MSRAKIRRTAEVLAVTGIACAMIFGANSAANADPSPWQIAETVSAPSPSYVALGDSFSAGTGAGNYIPDSKKCYRSANAYSAVWAAKHPEVPTRSLACSGATTATVLGTRHTAPQISAALAGATRVTMSVGGNDIGFADAISACLYSSDESCASHLHDVTIPAITDTLPAKLDAVYAKLHALAPNASVEIVGYPRLFDASSVECGAWSAPQRVAMNEVADLLSETIAERAEAAGFDYIDVRATFEGHEVCSSDPWIRNVFDGKLYEWMHPNAAGHAAQAALLAAPQHAEEVAAAWDESDDYTIGDQVVHDGSAYECIQAYQGWGDENWINAPSLWRMIS